MREILQGVVPYPQPSPRRNPGGDCFACTLTAAVRHIYPENPIDFNVAWEAFLVKSIGGSDVLSNIWPTMAHAAPYALWEHGYRLDVHKDIVMRETNLDRYSHAWYRAQPEQDFSKRLEAWLSAGWVAIAEMNYAGEGPYTPDGKINHTDHFVILDGQRGFWKKSETNPGCASWENETHVVCSAKGAYWIDTGQLMLRHGVAGLILLRNGVSSS